MTSKEFWRIFNQYCRKNQTANCSMKDHPLSGDHGAYEIAVFQNEAGKWCIESTIERSNNSHHDEFDTEEECFENLLSRHGWNLSQIGFPKNML